MSDLTPERRAELRQTLHYNGQPNFAVGRDIIAALLDAADERDRLVGNRREPRDLDWERSVDSYHAAGWDGEPGNYERMFFESGWRSAIHTLDGADS